MIKVRQIIEVHHCGRFEISFGMMSPTELRILLAVGNLVLIGKSEVQLLVHRIKFLDACGVGGAIALSAVFTCSALNPAINHLIIFQSERPLSQTTEQIKPVSRMDN